MPEHDEQGRYEVLARAALLEITEAATIGTFAGVVNEGEHTYLVQFACTKPGYPNWRWTVSLAHLPGEEPSVLEAELLPDEGAMLAPDWVPWADRLAEWEASQSALDDDEADDDSDDDADDGSADDDDPSDEDVLDDDEALLHSGDLDGVDIDDLDDDSGDDDSDDGDADDEE